MEIYFKLCIKQHNSCIDLLFDRFLYLQLATSMELRPIFISFITNYFQAKYGVLVFRRLVFLYNAQDFSYKA